MFIFSEKNMECFVSRLRNMCETRFSRNPQQRILHRRTVRQINKTPKFNYSTIPHKPLSKGLSFRYFHLIRPQTPTQRSIDSCQKFPLLITPPNNPVHYVINLAGSWDICTKITSLTRKPYAPCPLRARSNINSIWREIISAISPDTCGNTLRPSRCCVETILKQQLHFSFSNAEQYRENGTF